MTESRCSEKSKQSFQERDYFITPQLGLSINTVHKWYWNLQNKITDITEFMLTRALCAQTNRIQTKLLCQGQCGRTFGMECLKTIYDRHGQWSTYFCASDLANSNEQTFSNKNMYGRAENAKMCRKGGSSKTRVQDQWSDFVVSWSHLTVFWLISLMLRN